jgi:hypothetical protein
MPKDAKNLILQALGVSGTAVDIAQQVLDLEESDPNVVDVRPEARASKLLWKIGLVEPFESPEEVKAYLDKHEIPYTGILKDYPQGYIFENMPYHPDNFRGVFYKSSP